MSFFSSKKKTEEKLKPMVEWSREISREYAKKYVGRTFQSQYDYSVVTITGVALYQGDIVLLGSFPGTFGCTKPYFDKEYKEIDL